MKGKGTKEMKGKINKIVIMAIMFLILFLNNTVYAFGVELKTDKEIVNKNDEVTITIKADETVLASNFDVEFDNTMFEFIDSDTEGLIVSAKDNKVMCIFFDLEMKGKNEFTLKFKTLKDDKKASFSVLNAKFSTDISKESYEDESIDGINSKIEVKGSKYGNIGYIYPIVLVIIIMIVVTIIRKRRK